MSHAESHFKKNCKTFACPSSSNKRNPQLLYNFIPSISFIAWITLGLWLMGGKIKSSEDGVLTFHFYSQIKEAINRFMKMKQIVSAFKSIVPAHSCSLRWCWTKTTLVWLCQGGMLRRFKITCGFFCWDHFPLISGKVWWSNMTIMIASAQFSLQSVWPAWYYYS